MRTIDRGLAGRAAGGGRGPILFLLALEHGLAFGAHAALPSLAAILASEAFNFTYAWTCRARAWPIALSAGLLVWADDGHCAVRAAWHAVRRGALAAIAFGRACRPRRAAGAANLLLAPCFRCSAACWRSPRIARMVPISRSRCCAGWCSFVAFCLVLTYALPHWPIPLAFES